MRCCLNAQAQGEQCSCEKDELLVILCLKMQHDIRGSMGLSVQWFLIKLFSIDVKGGGNATIKGRILPSMPKGEIVGIFSLMEKEMAKALVMKKSSKVAENNDPQKRTEDEQKEQRQNGKSTKAQQNFGEQQHAFKKEGRNVKMN